MIPLVLLLKANVCLVASPSSHVHLRNSSSCGRRGGGPRGRRERREPRKEIIRPSLYRKHTPVQLFAAVKCGTCANEVTQPVEATLIIAAVGGGREQTRTARLQEGEHETRIFMDLYLLDHRDGFVLELDETIRGHKHISIRHAVHS